MDEELKKKLSKDADGLLTYEYIANHIGDCDDIMPELVENMIAVDTTGQFVASAARYLSAIGSGHYSDSISALISAAIDKDREHRYLPGLMSGIWGSDYENRAEELKLTDNNFRRIYKRLNPTSAI